MAFTLAGAQDDTPNSAKPFKLEGARDDDNTNPIAPASKQSYIKNVQDVQGEAGKGIVNAFSNLDKDINGVSQDEVPVSFDDAGRAYNKKGDIIQSRPEPIESAGAIMGNTIRAGVLSPLEAAIRPLTQEQLIKRGKTPEEGNRLASDVTNLGAIVVPSAKPISSTLGKVGDIASSSLKESVAANKAAVIPEPEALFKTHTGKQMNLSPKAISGGRSTLFTGLNEDEINPLNVAHELEKAKATGLPVRAIDVMTKENGGVTTHGKNSIGLFKAVANMPGKGAAMVGDLAARGYKGGERINQALDTVFSRRGVYDVSDEAFEKMKTEAPKAYKKAYEGGSTAPLEKQFESALNESSKKVNAAQQKINDINNKITQLEAKKQTNSNIYVDNNLINQKKVLYTELQKAQKELSTAESQKAQVSETLKQAQQDKKNGVKGAVWSPRIQQFLTDDTIQAGIKKGLWLAKKEALGNGETFNPSEWGITGYDEIGDPIVSKVPNMRLLDAGKRGLDAIIAENKNQFGEPNETARAVTILKNGYLKELDSLNPDYAKARKTYGDQASIVTALNEGRTFLKMDKEEIQKFMSDPDVSSAEKQAFTVGAKRAILDMYKLENTKNPIDNFWQEPIISKVRPLFSSEDAFKKFSNLMEHEKTMHRVNSAAATGSHTNMLKNFQQAVTKPAAILKGVMNPQGAAIDMGMDFVSKAMAKKALGLSKEQATVVAKYLTTDDPNLWYDLAKRMNQTELTPEE